MSDYDSRGDARDPQYRDILTLDRELGELTAELRTVIPGVTVLLAFLLTVPFSSGFPALGGIQQIAYFTAFLSTALALVLLLGEGAYHRIRGKPYDKGLLLKTATRQTVTALVLVGIALGAVISLVTDLLYGPGASVPLTAAVLALVAITWFGLPLKRRLRGEP
ncbi:DUF6328 family protein [Georgenia sp. AZ-5]|uniref:DUF6328 family protein n=1 Tax=Georgenia sp. AZ-5 TaxID=3367526 RepID=UPI0037547795